MFENNALTVSSTISVNILTDSADSVDLMTGNIYIPTNLLVPVLFTLPIGKPGQTYEIVGFGAGGWSICQLAGQSIKFGGYSTTPGETGALSSTLNWDCISILCVAPTQFVAYRPFGNPVVS